jgi:DNA-binding GntR family transcriptional regulator
MSEESRIEDFTGQIREQIERGDFGKSGRIPSITQLAKGWKVSRNTVYEVVNLLISEGLLIQRFASYFVNYPLLSLEGITKNFEQYLRDQGHEVDIKNIIEPAIEPMPHDIASLFGQPSGVHVVHRMRRQGSVDLPLRIAENWYPESLAGEFVEQMRADDSMDVIGAIKEKHGLYIVEHEDILIARIPTPFEIKELELGRTEPIMEIRRSNFAEDGTPIMWNKIIHRAPQFRFTYRKLVNHWK